MSERSIASIIGWCQYPLTLPGELFGGDDGADVHTSTWRHPTIPGNYPAYTVDDLIVWLADHDWFPYELYPDPSFALEAFDVYLRHISVPYDDEAVVDAWRKQFIQVGGPTLLEALSAAVRAVDSSSLAAPAKPVEVEARPCIPGAATSQGGPL